MISLNTANLYQSLSPGQQNVRFGASSGKGAVISGNLLNGADLRRQELLKGADLRDAELKGTDLRYTDLEGTRVPLDILDQVTPESRGYIDKRYTRMALQDGGAELRLRKYPKKSFG